MHTTLQLQRSTVRPRAPSQRGVVLIIGLILLMVLSMTAAYNMRGISSGELVTNNTRSQHLAMQSAEAALRYCEVGVANFTAVASTPTLVVAYTVEPAPAPATVLSTFTWADLTKWDGSGSEANVTVLGDNVLPLNDSGTIYKRRPECMAQFYQAASTKRVVVTARGFGPDVESLSGNNRPVPKGTEVWLQSVLQFP
jgi:type IV pilus assembly protein PilX